MPTLGEGTIGAVVRHLHLCFSFYCFLFLPVFSSTLFRLFREGSDTAESLVCFGCVLQPRALFLC